MLATTAAPQLILPPSYTRPPVNLLLGDPRVDPNTSPTYTLIGQTGEDPHNRLRYIGCDLNEAHTFTFLGGQGSGKSMNSDAIIEGALMPIPGINLLPSPFGAVYFHYSQTMDYAPEACAMVRPNDVPDQIKDLYERYNASPQGLSDVVIVCPKNEVENRKAQYPHIPVYPMLVNPKEMTAEQWLLMLGLIGDNSYSTRFMLQALEACRDNITVDNIIQYIWSAHEATADPYKTIQLSPDERRQVIGRVLMARRFMTNEFDIRSLLKPGRLIIVDIRDTFMIPEDAFTMMVVLFQIWCGVTGVKKIFKFGECHKYTRQQTPLTIAMIQAVREMRHKGIFIMFDSQDPLSVPDDILSMTDYLGIHRFDSRDWYDHLARKNMVVAKIEPSKILNLSPGLGLIISRTANLNDIQVTQSPLLVRYRPRVTKHGGDTKKTVTTDASQKAA